MWTCPNCGRVFKRANQPHSCHRVPLEKHFENKEKAKELFEYLVKQIHTHIGSSQIISIPCCVHLFSNYDFLGAFPKKDRLEISFTLNRKIENPRIKKYASMSANVILNCLDVTDVEEIDEELMQWLGESFHLKDK